MEKKKINKFKKLIKDFFMIQLPNYFYNEKDALIIDSYLPKLDELKLNILLKQFPQRYKFPKIEYDYQLRREEFGEIDTISKDPIVKFFAKNLKYLLPICFVESYAEINNKLKKLPFPEKNPNLFLHLMLMILMKFLKYGQLKNVNKDINILLGSMEIITILIYFLAIKIL